MDRREGPPSTHTGPIDVGAEKGHFLAPFGLRGMLARFSPAVVVSGRQPTARQRGAPEQRQCRTRASTSDKKKRVAKTSSVKRTQSVSSAATSARIARPESRASTGPSPTSCPVPSRPRTTRKALPSMGGARGSGAREAQGPHSQCSMRREQSEKKAAAAPQSSLFESPTAPARRTS